MKKLFKRFLALTLVICTLGSIIGGASAAGSPGGLVPPNVDLFSTIGNLPSKNRLSAIDLAGADIYIKPTQNGKASGSFNCPGALNYNGLDYTDLDFWDKFNGYYEYTYKYDQTTKRGNGTLTFSAHWETQKYRDQDSNIEKSAVAEWSGTIPFTAIAEKFNFFLVLPVVITWQEASSSAIRPARAVRHFNGAEDITVNYFVTKDLAGRPEYKSYTGQSDKYQTTQGTTIKAEFVIGDASFSDVKPGDYFYDAVKWGVSKGIVSGTGGLAFSPEIACKRAQIVTFLWRAKGSPSVSYNNPFNDIYSSDYYYNAVRWAAKNNIASGTSKTTFSPNGSCTRAQAVTFMWRAAGSPKVNATNKFRDVSTSDYFYQAVMWALSKGIVNGTSDTTFSPNQSCTRAQIITMLYRAR